MNACFVLGLCAFLSQKLFPSYFFWQSACPRLLNLCSASFFMIMESYTITLFFAQTYAHTHTHTQKVTEEPFKVNVRSLQCFCFQLWLKLLLHSAFACLYAHNIAAFIQPSSSSFVHSFTLADHAYSKSLLTYLALSQLFLIFKALTGDRKGRLIGTTDLYLKIVSNIFFTIWLVESSVILQNKFHVQ